MQSAGACASGRAGKEIDFENSLPNRFAVHEDSLVSAEDGWLAAAITSNVKIFEYLRAAGCPTQIEGSAPLLHVACQFNADPAVFDAVLAISDVNAVDAQGRTALMWMALSDATQNVQALLRAGADANRLDDEKRSALFYSLHLDHRMPKHIRDFVAAGARASNPSAISGDGMTAIAFAASDSRWAMVDVLCSVWGLQAAEEAALAATKTLMPHAAKLLAASQEKRDMQEAMRQSVSAAPLSATADENSVKEAVKTSRASKKNKTKGARRV